MNDISDAHLLTHLKISLKNERQTLAEFLEYLAEADRRRLHEAEAYSSLHKYCTAVLHLSEGAAYKRITAARLMRKFPVILSYVREGKIHLSGLTVIGPLLTEENHRGLLNEATHKTRKEVERIRARAEVARPPVG